jgi:hypothetical protein
MKLLKRGSDGPEVGLLRRMLNKQMRPSPNLKEANMLGSKYNGAINRINFGPKTDDAVRKFQRSKRIKDDGKVGPTTWGRLGLRIDINKAVTLSSQPTSDTCYAAAATMVLGPQGQMSFNPGPTPANTAADDHWAQSFADVYAWHIQHGMSPMPQALAGFLRAGPFWFAGNLPFPTGNSYHAVVVAAMWGTGISDQTMLKIYDPWPVNSGEIYGVILGDYTQRYPEAFRYILHR